jgi:hypothetical protein
MELAAVRVENAEQARVIVKCLLAHVSPEQLVELAVHAVKVASSNAELVRQLHCQLVPAGEERGGCSSTATLTLGATGAS